MSFEFEEVDLDNLSILRDPYLNKGTAFSREERIDLGLLGLLPYVVSTMDEQIKKRLQNFDDLKDEFAKVLFLKELRENNEVLYYKIIEKMPEKFLPFVYTPMVGETATHFSRYYTSPRGVFFCYPDRDHVDLIVQSIPKKEIEAIVITDGSRILGLGDLGAGGMAIPVGKLDLYTVFGGIHPEKVLPICLDVGTNNQNLIDDPLYIGWKHPRISGDEFFKFVDLVIKAIKKRYPKVLLQWEDFSKDSARPLLDHYMYEICSFNDDIQGTAASVLVALTSALKLISKELKDQKIAILGGGSAGTGIADLILHAAILAGVKEEEAKKRIFIVDINGLLLKHHVNLDPAQKIFAHDFSEVKEFDQDHDGSVTLLDVVIQAKPLILIGVSGQPNAFNEKVIKEMAKNHERPIIMPLSNPTSKAEAIPKDIINWTDGKAIIATGSPFEPVDYKGKTHVISQCNNVYVFPGLGLGLIASQAKHVPVELFIKAAEVISEEALNYSDGRLFPKISDLAKATKKLGLEIAKLVIQMKIHRRGTLETIEEIIRKLVWVPSYKKIVRKKSN